MTKVYYKATRPDGWDFYTGETINYADAIGGKVKVPSPPSRNGYSCCSGGVLHAADVPTMTLIGGSWPCRLFEVTGRPVAQEGRKYGFRSLRVVREVDAQMALGPQGEQIAAMVERAALLTRDEVRARGAAWGAAWGAARGAARDAAWGAAWGAARDAARDAAWGAARDAAWDAAWDAARGAAGLLVRDLVGTSFLQEHYDILTGPWRKAIGPLHPDDEVL